LIALDSPQDAVALLGHMRAQMGDAVSAFELMARLIIDLLVTGVPGQEDPLGEAYPWYVLMDVTSQGPPGSLHGPFSEALAGAQEAGLIRDALIASSGAQAAKLWKMRESLVEAQVSAGGTIAHDVSVPVSRIPEFIARANAAVVAAYPGVRPCAFGHVGDGNMHYNPVRPRDWDGARFKEERPRINRIVHDIVVELGGSISAEHGIGQSRLAELAHYKAAVEIKMMRAVKRALDPKGIMNPGQVVPACGRRAVLENSPPPRSISTETCCGDGGPDSSGGDTRGRCRPGRDRTPDHRRRKKARTLDSTGNAGDRRATSSGGSAPSPRSSSRRS
jgi:FAD/FMN-containing dehydrogenase